MALATIHYDNNLRFESELNIDDLKMGGPIYVNGNTKEVSLQPKRKYKQYYIEHIARGSRYVKIHNGEYDTFDDVEYIFGELEIFFGEGKVSIDIVQKAIMYSAKNIRPRRMHKTKEIQSQLFKKWKRVLGRMNLCQRLKNPDVGKALFCHWSPLIEYHCLTCFDLLGQKERYAEFGEWIKSSDYKSERENVDVPNNISQVGIAELYYSEYQKIYGVKNSFFNFIDNVLDRNDLEVLLNSIKIEKTGINIDVYELANKEEKKKYLYALRNLYTHNLDAQGGVHPNLFQSEMSNRWVSRKQIINQIDFHTYSVYGWPDMLISTVMNGLKNQIEQYAQFDQS